MSTRTFLTPATRERAAEVIAVEVNDGGEQQFLTPATPDKSGELIIRKRVAANSNEPQQYAAPVPYFVANYPQVADLRAKVQQAESALRHAKARNAPSAQVAKLEGALRSLKAELEAAEDPRREQRQRERTGGDDAPPTRNTQQARNTIPWDKMLADLDAKLASHKAGNSSAVCCEGAYLCPKCKQKAAA